MVVCKCRKATKLYCFVHKVPVCGECICFEEHKICVVRTYSEWVIDGEYDWPPKCCRCGSTLEPENDTRATRLGCLHVIHTDCFISHLKEFPHHTPSAGYVCPACSTPIWPPASIKDSSSLLHSKLKEAILQSGLEKNLFGNLPVSLPSLDIRAPPAFASEPLIDVTAGSKEQGPNMSSGAMRNETGGSIASGKLANVTVVNSFSESNFVNKSNISGAGSTSRKHVDRQNSDISYFVDDEDGSQKKYTRRGPFHHKFLRALLPFWSTALPTLPVTAPPRKDASHGDDGIEARSRNQRLSRTDPRKILLFVAIMACMATMAILYYRLAQRDIGDEFPDEELQ